MSTVTPGEGQAPDPAATPQAGNTSPTAPQAGNGQTPGMTLDEALAEIKKVRAEAASHRVKLTAYEKAQAEAEAAKLSDIEKAAKRAEDAEARAATYRKTIADQEIRIKAALMKFRDPDDAVTALSAKLEIDEATGLPKDLEKALDALAKAKPYLLEGDPPKVPLSSGSTANPARNGSGQLSKEVIQAMSEPERQARLPEILEWASKQPR